MVEALQAPCSIYGFLDEYILAILPSKKTIFSNSILTLVILYIDWNTQHTISKLSVDYSPLCPSSFWTISFVCKFHM